MSLLINFLLVIYALVALLMILVILMQRPKSEGLGAAFGGGVTENIFGAQTTNVLTKFTTWLATFFFLLTFVLSILYAHHSTGSNGLRRELMKGQPASGSAATVSPGAPKTGQASPSAASTQGSPARQAENAAGSVTPPASSPTPTASARPNP
jgi:preprotein translocase subunit SecG